MALVLIVLGGPASRTNGNAGKREGAWADEFHVELLVKYSR